MLTIRPEQMEVFRKAALQKFEDKLVGHLREYAPRHSEALGGPGIRQVIRLGLDRAAAYGFTTRRTARFYLEMMYLLGSDFDTDPLLPWVAAVLTDPDLADPMTRADRHYDAATTYRAAVFGPDYEHETEALRRAAGKCYEDWRTPVGCARPRGDRRKERRRMRLDH